MPDNISILICTHNRAPILRRALESLSALELPGNLKVELVVVANACSDDTSEVVKRAGASLPFQVRCMAEDRIGLSVARNRAMSESTSDILAFLDDDVLVDPRWLVELMRGFNETGADLLGGHVDLWWDNMDPPAWFNAGYTWLLSGCDLGTDPFEMSCTRGAIGANFSFRRKVVDSIGQFRSDLGRNGKQMGAGEETNFVERALAAGFKAFHWPAAIVQHWVPPERATPEYVCSAMEGYTRSNILRREQFGIFEIIRSVSGNAMFFGQHAVGQKVANLRKDEADVVRHQIRLAASRGAISGAIQRLIGNNNKS